jgi:polyhydroxybutyrate depolymerase
MLSRTPLLVLLAAVLVLGTACEPESSATPDPSARPSPATGLASGTSAHTLTVDGRRRAFRVYRPAGLPAGTPAPLVVMLHGALGDGGQAQASYGWDAQADQGQFLVAYPDGVSRSWAVSKDCCGPPAGTGVDDVAFVTSMVTAIAAATPVDRARVYATGISNGGMLAYRLACDTTMFAAIGAVAATLLGPCSASAGASVIHVHGTADQTVPYQGGPGRRNNVGRGAYPANTNGPPIPQLIETWGQRERCPRPATTTAGEVTTAAASCPEGRGVTLVTVTGAGHQWPGQPGPRGALARAWLDPPSQALDATAQIWSFFRGHPKR